MGILRFPTKRSLFSITSRTFASNPIENPNPKPWHSSRGRFSRFSDDNNDQNQRFNKPSQFRFGSISSLYQKFLNPNPNFRIFSKTAFSFRVLARDLTSTYKTIEVFESWMKKYNKNYSSMEEKLHRFEIFRKNLKFIDEVNNMKLSYWCGLNAYADLTVEEFPTGRRKF